MSGAGKKWVHQSIYRSLPYTAWLKREAGAWLLVIKDRDYQEIGVYTLFRKPTLNALELVAFDGQVEYGKHGVSLFLYDDATNPSYPSSRAAYFERLHALCALGGIRADEHAGAVARDRVNRITRTA